MKSKKNTKDFQSVGDLLSSFDWDKDKSISHEFQDYGYHLAQELHDLEHKALYIKFAKELPRPILEKARNFVKDAYQVKKPASLFMWKLKELKKEREKDEGE